LVFYVSPYDIKEFLEEVLEVMGDRRVCICREMTKFFEEYLYGKLSEVKDKVKEKGEFVVVVGKQHL
jgi:16S rRNA (cytidine1402-2'-O)-methyltransferase